MGCEIEMRVQMLRVVDLQVALEPPYGKAVCRSPYLSATLSPTSIYQQTPLTTHNKNNIIIYYFNTNDVLAQYIFTFRVGMETILRFSLEACKRSD